MILCNNLNSLASLDYMHACVPYMQGCEAAVVKYLTTNVITVGGVGFFYALIEVYDSTN